MRSAGAAGAAALCWLAVPRWLPWIGVGTGGARGSRHARLGRRHWSWLVPAAAADSGEIEVALDLQPWLLLRCRHARGARRRAGSGCERAGRAAHWDALAPCGIFARQRRSRRRRSAAAAPQPSHDRDASAATASPADTDLMLVERTVAGDQKAFELLVDQVPAPHRAPDRPHGARHRPGARTSRRKPSSAPIARCRSSAARAPVLHLAVPDRGQHGEKGAGRPQARSAGLRNPRCAWRRRRR